MKTKTMPVQDTHNDGLCETVAGMVDCDATIDTTKCKVFANSNRVLNDLNPLAVILTKELDYCLADIQRVKTECTRLGFDVACNADYIRLNQLIQRLRKSLRPLTKEYF